MKRILLAALVIGLAACEKEPVSNTPAHPQMTYRDLSATVVNITTPAGVDINGDGPSDVWFDIWPTRDEALGRDFHRFTVTPGEGARLLVNAANGTPIIPQGGAIKLYGENGYEWKAPATADLAKRTLVRGVFAPAWEGAWKDVQHKFLAVQLTANGVFYNGWIELSFDTAREKVVLHRSGISREAGREVIAGQ